MSLYVDIEKTCGDFTLKAAFETENEVFAILGASGCGKSLTLKCIAGIEKPDRGLIRLDGEVLFDSQRHVNIPARKRDIGYLFQDYALFPNMTVFENIMCGAKNRALAQEFVAKFYLEGKEKLYPRQLSGGQKQRVALARMLSAKPRYLLLDEPFSALDNHLKSKLELELMELLDDYGRRALFVSHDRDEVYRLTDRIAVMENGSVEDIRPKAELFEAPRTLAATLLTGCRNVTRLEQREEGLYAPDWGMYLRTAAGNTSRYRYAAVRAHCFETVEREPAGQAQGGEARCTEAQAGAGAAWSDCIECEILREIEDNFTVEVLFRSRHLGQTGEQSALIAEFPKEEWAQLRDRILLRGKVLRLRIPEEKIIWLEK